MNTAVPVRLTSAQLLEIAGADAIGFAQAQFSSDARALDLLRWQWSAWLSAQGRVRALFHLLRTGEDRLQLLLRGTSAEALHAALAPFVMRSRVHLQVIRIPALGLYDAGEAADILGAAPREFELIQRTPACGFAVPGRTPRWCVLGSTPDAAIDASANALDRWRGADIDAALPELADSQVGHFLPDWLGLPGLGAVSTSKGCYPGQEIVARLHFRGGGKRRLYRVEFDAPMLPAPGTSLAGPSDRPDGELLNAAWSSRPRGIALAVLRELPPGTLLEGAEPARVKFRVVCPVDPASN